MQKPNLVNSLRMALGFLTVLPVPQRTEWSDPDFGFSAVFYPLAGVLIGALAGGSFLLLKAVFPLPIAALLSLVVWIMLSGALHWDGLADCMDGFGCSAAPEKRLEIMKDPKLGTFGALGLFTALLLKWLCIWQFPAGRELLYFALSAATARWAMLLLIGLPLANPNGMAAMLKKNCPKHVVLYAIPVPLILAIISGLTGLCALLLSAAAASALGLLAKRKIGGINGDVLGFSIELSEIVLLLAAQVLP